METLRELVCRLAAATADIFTWNNIVSFGNSNFFSSVSGALCGAFAGAYIAHRIFKRHNESEELLKEIRNVNAAVNLAIGACNDGLSLKKQIVLPMWNDYVKFKEATLVEIEKAKRGESSQKAIAFSANLASVPVPNYPIERLTQKVLEGVNVFGRTLSAATALAVSNQHLINLINQRNQLIELYKKGSGPADPNFPALYLGLEQQGGHIDTYYQDTLKGIFTYTDDVIFFSKVLCEGLVKHGKNLKKKLKRVNKALKVKIAEVDFSTMREAGLMPDQADYEDWLKGFSHEKDSD